MSEENQTPEPVPVHVWVGRSAAGEVVIGLPVAVMELLPDPGDVDLNPDPGAPPDVQQTTPLAGLLNLPGETLVSLRLTPEQAVTVAAMLTLSLEGPEHIEVSLESVAIACQNIAEYKKNQTSKGN